MNTALRGLDAWLTREPPGWDDDIPLPPKCNVCGRFLKDEPLHVIIADDVEACDGTVHPEFGALCEGYSYDGWRSQCQPHEPHFFVVNAYTVIYRQCSGGHIAKEFVI